MSHRYMYDPIADGPGGAHERKGGDADDSALGTIDQTYNSSPNEMAYQADVGANTSGSDGSPEGGMFRSRPSMSGSSIPVYRGNSPRSPSGRQKSASASLGETSKGSIGGVDEVYDADPNELAYQSGGSRRASSVSPPNSTSTPDRLIFQDRRSIRVPKHHLFEVMQDNNSPLPSDIESGARDGLSAGGGRASKGSSSLELIGFNNKPASYTEGGGGNRKDGYKKVNTVDDDDRDNEDEYVYSTSPGSIQLTKRPKKRSRCCGSAAPGAPGACSTCGSKRCWGNFFIIFGYILLLAACASGFYYFNARLDETNKKIEKLHMKHEVMMQTMSDNEREHHKFEESTHGELKQMQNHTSYRERYVDGVLVELYNHSNAEVLESMEATKKDIQYDLKHTKSDIEHLSRQLNENVTTIIEDAHDKLELQLGNTVDMVHHDLEGTKHNVTVMVNNTEHDLVVMKKDVKHKMDDTVLEINDNVKLATEELEQVQANMTARMTLMRSSMTKMAKELNDNVAQAQDTINSEVDEVKNTINEYVAITNKEFAAQNDFVRYQLAGTFALLSCLISLWHLTSHLRHYHKDAQKRVMAILWMVPIYSITSWLSLVFPSFEGAFGAVKDCYEAYAIYTFIAFLVDIVQDGHDIHRLIEIITENVIEERKAHKRAIDNDEKPPVLHLKPPCPCCYVRLGEINLDSPTIFGAAKMASAWLWQCRFFALQFVMIKPVLTLLPYICILCRYDYFGNVPYSDGRFNFGSVQLYNMILANVSVALAFYGLLQFYHGLEKEIAWCNPWPKFLCIKGVVFMTFWQGIALSAMSSMGLVEEKAASQLQNLLICLEMLLASLAHYYIFPSYEWAPEYKLNEEHKQKVQILGTLAFKDFFKDVKQMVQPSSWQDQDGDMMSPSQRSKTIGDKEAFYGSALVNHDPEAQLSRKQTMFQDDTSWRVYNESDEDELGGGIDLNKALFDPNINLREFRRMTLAGNLPAAAAPPRAAGRSKHSENGGLSGHNSVHSVHSAGSGGSGHAVEGRSSQAGRDSEYGQSEPTSPHQRKYRKTMQAIDESTGSNVEGEFEYHHLERSSANGKESDSVPSSDEHSLTGRRASSERPDAIYALTSRESGEQPKHILSTSNNTWRSGSRRPSVPPPPNSGSEMSPPMSRIFVNKEDEGYVSDVTNSSTPARNERRLTASEMRDQDLASKAYELTERYATQMRIGSAAIAHGSGQEGGRRISQASQLAEIEQISRAARDSRSGSHEKLQPYAYSSHGDGFERRPRINSEGTYSSLSDGLRSRDGTPSPNIFGDVASASSDDDDHKFEDAEGELMNDVESRRNSIDGPCDTSGNTNAGSAPGSNQSGYDTWRSHRSLDSSYNAGAAQSPGTGAGAGAGAGTLRGYESDLPWINSADKRRSMSGESAGSERSSRSVKFAEHMRDAGEVADTPSQMEVGSRASSLNHSVSVIGDEGSPDRGPPHLKQPPAKYTDIDAIDEQGEEGRRAMISPVGFAHAEGASDLSISSRGLGLGIATRPGPQGQSMAPVTVTDVDTESETSSIGENDRTASV